MEVSVKTYKWWLRVMLVMIMGFLFTFMNASAQTYSLRNGRMYVEVRKDLSASAISGFVAKYNLEELDLHRFMKTNNPDSINKLGWIVELNNKDRVILSRSFEAFGNSNQSADRIVSNLSFKALFPATSSNILYGVNKFRKKFPFTIADSFVTFFMRGNNNAGTVLLSGSFNDWASNAKPMQRTDSGWITRVKLGPGKWWYKFIVDGNWLIDTDNELRENDGLGNVNSVFYKPNYTITTTAFPNAKKVFVAGSFNNWKQNELSLTRTTYGWQLPIFLSKGTHRYKFIVDGKWQEDPNNKDRLPDGNGGYNSVLRFGQTYLFQINGQLEAKQMVMAGSFNNWRRDELYLQKTSTGWELKYTLGPGNYEYKFYADGKLIGTAESTGNHTLIIEPNYTFRLKGFNDAKKILVAGDFNNWSEDGFALKKQGDTWVLSMHLHPGKHLYKFIVDNNWIIDPANKLWEQNEFGTGNSVIWIDE